MSPARLAAALVLAAIGLALGLYAWGREENEPGAPLSAECSPPLYREIVASDSYKDETVLLAREDEEFNLRGEKLVLTPPIDWDQNPNNSTSFQGKLQDLGWVDPLLYAHRAGDEGALEQARDIVVDWIESNPFVNPYEVGRERGDSKQWIDKVSAARVQVIAYVAAAAKCEGILDSASRKLLRDSLEVHGTFLASDDSYHETNHGLYVDRGLYLLGELAPDLDDAKAWQEHAAARFADTLRQHLAADEGFWLEHSAGYQLAISRLVDDMVELTGSKEQQVSEIAKAMRPIAGWMIEPDGQTLLYGDSDLKEPLASELRSSRSPQGLKFLPKTGLAFVRRQDPGAYLAMLASFHEATHKDADELSFDLYDHGHRIVSDTGLYHKDFDEYFDFQNSPQAHSGLQVAGGEIPIADENAYGSGLYAAGSGAGWYAVWGTNPLLTQLDVEHRRLWVYRPGYALVVVDLVRSPTTQTYERYVQFGPDLEVSESEDGAFELTAEGLDATFTSSASAEEETALVRGQKEPLGGYVFPSFREKIPRYTATISTEAANLDAVMTFGLDPSEQVSAELLPGASDEVLGLRLQDSGTDVGQIIVSRDGGELGVAVSAGLEGESLPKKVEPTS